jgi:hypothetical protein
MFNPQRIFEEGQPVHIISRAVDGKKIFADRDDCCRFIFQIYAANTGSPAYNLRRKDINKAAMDLLRGHEIPSDLLIKGQAPLVHILDFALVVNHYHLYVLANSQNGIPIFMRKLNIGFAKHFNLKNKRRGTLFESRYKCVLIETDFQSDAVSRYIGVINPLDVFQPGWREGGLENPEQALDFLENYEFSSFPDRIRKRAAKILAPLEIREKYWPEAEQKNQDYLNFIKGFLAERKINASEPLFLE